MAVNIITSNTFKGAFLKVLELIKEFLNCELKVEDIKDCEDAVLSKKMHDLRLIYEEYLKLTEDKLDLSKLLDFFLEKSDFFDLSKYNLYFVKNLYCLLISDL